jgi:hypothetical protein
VLRLIWWFVSARFFGCAFLLFFLDVRCFPGWVSDFGVAILDGEDGGGMVGFFKKNLEGDFPFWKIWYFFGFSKNCEDFSWCRVSHRESGHQWFETLILMGGLGFP